MCIETVLEIFLEIPRGDVTCAEMKFWLKSYSEPQSYLKSHLLHLLCWWIHNTECCAEQDLSLPPCGNGKKGRKLSGSFSSRSCRTSSRRSSAKGTFVYFVSGPLLSPCILFKWGQFRIVQEQQTSGKMFTHFTLSQSICDHLNLSVVH